VYVGVGVRVLVNVEVNSTVFVLVGEITTKATQLDEPLSLRATFKTPVEVGDGVGVLVLVGVNVDVPIACVGV
jgi:hypothetical protein